MNNAITDSQLRLAAARAQGYAADVAAAAAEVMEEMDSAKADKPWRLETTLSATGWLKEEADIESDEEDDIERSDISFSYYYDISAQITTDDEADVHIVPASISVARECGFCPMVETLDGAIRVRAQLQPETDIRVECTITKGVTQ